VSCSVGICVVMLYYVMLCYVMLCYVMLYVTLCYVMLLSVVRNQDYVMLCGMADLKNGDIIHMGLT
jgi:hypothetical protein